MRRHAGVRAGGTLHVLVDEPRRREEGRDLAPLTWPENPEARPYLDAHGEVVIPLDTPWKFRWWAGGQSVQQTRKELAG
ncbi:MAG: hypothetical protein HY323_09315 [Betaproteobacteria bacterium]|nr:hypothetical protein [Betaproteobacteria bacterium]